MKHSDILDTLQNLTNIRVKQRELAEILEKPINTIGNRAKRDSSYSVEEIRKIGEYFGVDLLNNKEISHNMSQNNDFINTPVRGDVSASCGIGSMVYNEEQTAVFPISKLLYKSLGASLTETDIIFATGDSMEPEIKDGDALMVDRSKRDIVDGQIYIIRCEGQLMCKRLQMIPPKKIKVISDNKDKYDPFYIDFSQMIDFDFEVVGRVLWYSRIAR